MNHPQTTAEYLAAIKAKHSVSSDYALSKLMGVRRAAVSHWQTGKRQFDTRTCFRVAELLGDQPAAVIAHIEAERAEKAGRAEEAEDWKAVLRKLASILLVATLGGFSNADARLASSQGIDQDIHRVKRRRRPKKASPWSGLLSFSPALAL